MVKVLFRFRGLGPRSLDVVTQAGAAVTLTEQHGAVIVITVTITGQWGGAARNNFQVRTGSSS
jgi:hypothetical protein